MKKFLIAVTLLLCGLAPSSAQWQTPLGSVPIGRGSGTGFSSAAPGTAGYVLMSNGAGVSPSFTAYIQALTNTVPRTWNAKASDVVSVKDWCPTAGIGLIDDAACIRTAINNTPTGYRLVAPPGTYLLATCETSNGGKAALNFASNDARDRAISFEGLNFGWNASVAAGGYGNTNLPGGTVFLLSASFPADCDVFRFAGTKPLQGRTLKNFLVRPFIGASAFYGQHMINFDGVEDAYYEFQVTIENVYLTNNAASTGYAIRSSGSASNAGGVVNQMTIQNNFLMSGIKMTLAGDTIRILNNGIGANSVTGSCGVDVTQFTGGGHLYIAGNNINNTSCRVKVGQSASARVVDNYIETNANGVVSTGIEFTSTASWPSASGNLITNNGNQSGSVGVAIGASVVGAQVEDNTIVVPSGATAITNAGTDTNFGLNRMYVGGVRANTSITDSGSGSTYVPQSARATFFSGDLLVGDADGKVNRSDDVRMVSNNLQLGQAGIGGIGLSLANATSGRIRIVAPTGVALGTSTLTTPGATDTLVGRATTDTLTNKTIDGNFNTISNVSVGGSAGGDLTGTYPNPTLAAIISAAGPIGSATVTPIITYDAKGRLTTVTSATITPAIGSITGLGTGVATALGVNTGSAGAVVLFNGALGTPSSGTLTNATGLPISSGVSGLGSNVATFLGTPSSANLRSALTDETGSGAAVFADTPTLITPVLGVATATSINKVAITTPATAATLTISDNKTLTVSNTFTFSGNDGSTVNFTSGGTLPYLGAANTWTANNFYNGGAVVMGASSSIGGKTEAVGDLAACPTTGTYGQFEINGATTRGKRLTFAFDTTNNFGCIQALENATAFRDLLLNPRGGNVGIGLGASTAPAVKLDVAGPVKVGVTTVGGLPTCNASTQGTRSFVTDSNAASYTAGIGAVVAAGGALAVPVTCDGVNWRIG